MATSWSKLITQMSLDATGFMAGMLKAEGAIKRFATGLKGQLASAFTAGAVTVWTKNLIERGRAVKQLSEDLNISGKTVFKWGQAAEAAGVSFETLDSMLMRMMKTLGGPEGQAKLGAVFRSLGKDFSEFSKLRPEQQIEALMDALGSAPTTPEVIHALSQLAGRGAGSLKDVAEDAKGFVSILGDIDPSGLKDISGWFNQIKAAAATIGTANLLNFRAAVVAIKNTLRDRPFDVFTTGKGVFAEEFVKELRRSQQQPEQIKGPALGILDALPEKNKDAEKALELLERLEELQWKNSWMKLGPLQQEAKIRERMNTLLREATEREAKNPLDPEAIQRRIDAANLESELLQRERTSPESTTKELFKADQLARIGGMVNGSSVAQSWRGDIRAIRDMLLRKGIKIYGEL